MTAIGVITFCAVFVGIGCLVCAGLAYSLIRGGRDE